MSEALTIEFDEFTDDTFLAEHFDNCQNQVGCGGAFCKFTSQFKADHVRDQH
ncbi:MAG: Uncharacterised protein [Hyphomonas sp. TMED17]|nr:MAG: Uncharacterised protein [Hyphomonas sp. TMED17]